VSARNRAIDVEGPAPAGILNWYDFPISSGALEGINNKIGALQRMASGYRDHEYFIATLYALHLAQFALIGSSLASMTRTSFHDETAVSWRP